MYVDEAGDFATLRSPAGANDQPIFILGGLMIASNCLRSFTSQYLAIKRRFFPKLVDSKHHFDWMLAEIKGSDVKKSALNPSRNRSRQARLFLGEIVTLVEKHEGTLAARIWVKEPGQQIKHRSIYTYSVQSIFASFDSFLEVKNSSGICIADARTKQLNEYVAHSLFTQKHGMNELYPRVEEVPLFGHSNNHAGLQVNDILMSGIVMPIACLMYCKEFVQNVHVNERAIELRELFGVRLKALQYRYVQPGTGKYSGGFAISDPVNKRSGAHLFG